MHWHNQRFIGLQFKTWKANAKNKITLFVWTIVYMYSINFAFLAILTSRHDGVSRHRQVRAIRFAGNIELPSILMISFIVCLFSARTHVTRSFCAIISTMGHKHLSTHVLTNFRDWFTILYSVFTCNASASSSVQIF